MTDRQATQDQLDRAIRRLVERPIGGYHAVGPNASEPTAWATLALATAERSDAASRGAEWLADRQSRDGSVGVTDEESTPAWTTALAMLAWRAVDPVAYAQRIEHAAAWALDQEPWTRPRDPLFGHDTTLAGWSWAADTHSWVEPTAFFAVALREAGLADHPRRLEAVRLLVDRLLPSGGANYGNTTVFGQELLRHVQTSGVVAWALAAEDLEPNRLDATLAYLTEATEQPTGVASLAWAVRGLAAHGQTHAAARAALAAAWPRVAASGGVYKTALFALAAQAEAALPLPEATLATSR